MSNTNDIASEVEKKVTGIVRVGIGVAGLVALVAGVLILVAPQRTATAVAAIIAVYALVEGIVYLGIAIFGRSRTGWGRVGFVLLGVLFLVAAVMAFQNLTVFALTLAVTLSIIVGALWVVEGVVALSQLGESSSKIWTVLFALLSIIAGITLFFSPLLGAVVLWWLLGISLVVLGVVQVVRAFRIGR
ncbi:Uncharacterized membrane protein HdeD, DUF308 family [Ruaniaceae bacterium KH17]|nr:Uncharacterized membrane protein HdeD, DUF308 family [Ruaniaceae bacterium KH17]